MNHKELIDSLTFAEKRRINNESSHDYAASIAGGVPGSLPYYSNSFNIYSKTNKNHKQLISLTYMMVPYGCDGCGNNSVKVGINNFFTAYFIVGDIDKNTYDEMLPLVDCVVDFSIMLEKFNLLINNNILGKDNMYSSVLLSLEHFDNEDREEILYAAFYESLTKIVRFVEKQT